MLELQQLYTNNNDLKESELQIIERGLLKKLIDMYDDRYLES